MLQARQAAAPKPKAPGDSTQVTTLFQGYDTFRGSATATAVEGISKPGGVPGAATFAVCANFQSLMAALTISQSASASLLSPSLSEKLDFIQSLQLTPYSVVAVVYASAVTDSWAYSNAKWIVPPPADFNTFYQTYGDSFVGEIVQGAEFYAALVFDSRSKEEFENWLSPSGVLGANFSPDRVVGLTATIQGTLETVLRQTGTELNWQMRVAGFITEPPDQNAVIPFALNFIRLNPTNPTTLRFTAVGYENVPGDPQSFNLNPKRELFLNTLVPAKAALDQLMSQMDWVSQVYSTYGYTGDRLLGVVRLQMDGDYAAVRNLVEAMRDNPTLEYGAPSFSALGNGAPNLSVRIETSPAWGGNGGIPFQDVTAAAVTDLETLTQVQINGGDWVDHLKCTYSTRPPVTLQHGLDGGIDSGLLNLQPGEFITSISGSFGEYVNQLNLTTLRQTPWTWPPSPRSAPNSFSWSVPPSSALLGFQGRSGKYLDQVQAVFVVFSPAVWL